MEPNDGPADVIPGTLSSSEGGLSDLLRRNTLVFVCEQFRGRGWLFEHVHTAMAEQRIFDEAGNEVGRVTEQPPCTKPTLENGGHYGKTVRAAVYDSRSAKIVEFAGMHGVRKLLGRNLEWGRRLEVADGAGRRVGSLVAGEFKLAATLEGRLGERIGAANSSRWNWGSSFNWNIQDSTGTEVGWIADDRRHAKAVACKGMPVAPTNVKHRWMPGSRHVLAITGDVSPDLRLLMLAASAGVHLVLSPWSGPRE